MPFTLNEYKASSENAIARGVIDEFRRSSWLLDNLPFDDSASLSSGQRARWVYQYDRITTEPTAAVRAVNAEYSAQEAKTTALTVELKIFGGKFQVDRTQIGTARYGSRIAFQAGQKVKASRALFNHLFINGDDASSALEFDGLAAALAGSSTEATATADLSTSALIDTNYKKFLDELFDFLALLDGTPSALLMNRSMKSRLRSVAMRAGYLTQSEDAFGRNVEQFDGIPFIDLGDRPGSANPVVATVADASAANTTSIYAVRLGLDGVHGVAPEGGQAFLKTYMPNLTDPGAVKDGEVEMVAAMALKATKAAGVLKGIPIAA